jgi:hypothetical protein
MTLIDPKIYKAPRWITTEAGQWAYLSDGEWRRTADIAFNVAERRRLLDEAERMHERSVPKAVAKS